VITWASLASRNKRILKVNIARWYKNKARYTNISIYLIHTHPLIYNVAKQRRYVTSSASLLHVVCTLRVGWKNMGIYRELYFSDRVGED